MTPKESLNRIKQYLSHRGSFYKQFTASDEEFDKDVANVEKALTELEAPTSDEVCKALSEYMKAKVNYIPHRLKKNGFYLVNSGIYLISLGYDNQVNFSYNDWMKFNNLPPHLITLIGRFYEGVGK